MGTGKGNQLAKDFLASAPLQIFYSQTEGRIDTYLGMLQKSGFP